MALEVELRAHLPQSMWSSLFKEIQSLPGYVVQARSFIDYSTFSEGIGERTRDVRVRVTNGSPEIIVKTGVFGAAVRNEASVHFGVEELDNALEMMSMLGFKKGVLGGRRIHRARAGNVEVALQEVLDVSRLGVVADRFIEVEFCGAVSNLDSAELELGIFLRDRGLVAFTIDLWNEYVRSLNSRWNGVYTHGETNVQLVLDLGR